MAREHPKEKEIQKKINGKEDVSQTYPNGETSKQQQQNYQFRWNL